MKLLPIALIVFLLACTPVGDAASNMTQEAGIATLRARLTPVQSETSSPTPISPTVLAPLPTYTPYPTYTALPTYTPRPVIVIRETVVVTATATPTVTPTPVPTATATPTPTPTATPRPPIVQVMQGKGSQVLAPRTFTPSRPLELTIEVSGSGEFSLNAVAPNAEVLQVMSGTAPFGAATVYLISDDGAFNEFNIPAIGITWVVTAGPDVSWKVTTTQKAPAQRVDLPYEIESSGNSYSSIVLLQAHTEIVLRHGSFDSFTVDLIAVHGGSCCQSHRIFSAEKLDTGSAVLYNQSGVGEYIMRIQTEPGVPWSIEVK